MSTNVTQSIDHFNHRPRWPGRTADTIGHAVDHFLGRRGREAHTGPLPPHVLRGEIREGGRAIRL